MTKAIIAASLCLFVLGGCNIGSFARVNPNTIASYGVPDSRPGAELVRGSETNIDCPFVSGLDDTQTGAINLDCFRFPGDPTTAKTAYQQAAATTAPGGNDTAVLYARNRLAAVLVKHADDVCVLEKGRIVGREGALNFGLGSATTALSTIATIVTGEATKSIFSGGAAFTSGARGHAAESFYRNQVTQAINAAMDGEREKVRGEIETGRGKSMANFTVDDMIRLVNQYHQACSYERGLQLLVKAAVNQEGFNSIAANRTAATRMANLMLQRDAVKRDLASASGTRKTELEAQLKQWEDAIFAAMNAGAEDPPAPAPADPPAPAPADPPAPAPIIDDEAGKDDGGG